MAVKGKMEPVTIYELVAEKGDISSIDLEFIKSFNQAVDLYKNKEWDSTIKQFKKLLDKKPDDLACKIFIERAEEFKINPPNDDWSGEYIFLNK